MNVSNQYRRIGLCLLILALVIALGAAGASASPAGSVAPSAGPAATATPVPCGTAASVTWSPASSSTNPYTSFALRIYINVAGGLAVDGADVNFGWDPTYLSVQSVQIGSSFPSVLKNQSTGANSWWIAAGNTSSNPPFGNLLFATVNFRSLNGLVNNTPLTFGSITVSCGVSGALNVSKGAGYVTIVAPPPTATRTQTPTITPTPTPVRGNLCLQTYEDVNRNGTRDQTETLVSGSMITVTDALSNVVATYTGDGVTDPYCVSLLPGVYYVAEKDPPRFSAPIPERWKVTVTPLDTVQTYFGVAPEAATGAGHDFLSPSAGGGGGPGLKACGTAASVVWGPSSVTVNPYQTFNLNIYVNVAGGAQADGADVTFSWNPAYLSVVNIVPGGGFRDHIYMSIGTSSARYASGALSGDPPAGSIHMATVTFRSLSTLVTNSPLTWAGLSAACHTVPFTSVGGSTGYVNIVPPPPTATRTQTPTVTSTPTPVTSDLCVLVYSDTNSNNWREADEALVAGEIVSVTNATTGLYVGAYTTNGVSEPYCFRVLPGSYIVWGKDPAGYGGRRPEQWGAGLGPDTEVEVGFGLQLSSGQTPSPTPTTQPSATATQTPMNTATRTETPTATHTMTNTATPTAVPTATLTPTAIATATSTAELTPTYTATVTRTATKTLATTPTETATSLPDMTATPTPSVTWDATPTPTATASTSPVVTETPTSTPTPVAAETTVTATATATLPAPTPVRYSVFLPYIVGDNPGRIFLPYIVNDLGETSSLILPILQVQ